MQNIDMNTFTNVFGIVFGFCSLVFNKEIAKSMIEYQYKTTHKRYRIDQFQFPIYLVGTGVLICGILGLFHMINFIG